MKFCKTALAAMLVSALGAAPGCDARRAATEAVRPSFEALDDALEKGLFPETTSVIIVDHDETLFENYYGDGGSEVLNNTRSATKSVTALAIGAAIADGAISSLDAPAFEYLSDLAPFAYDGPAKRAIVIRDLLTMSSALDCNDSDPESPGNEENMYPLAEWARWATDLPIDESAAGEWRYCTAGTVLLGRIIQNATGKSVDRYIERRILDPLGVSERKWFFSESGEAMTGGGLELRSRDLAKLAGLVLQRGAWAGDEIVPAAFIDDALTIHKKANEEQDYGYLFWRRDYHTACGDEEGWYMAGNGGNAIVMFRNLSAAIVVTRTRYNTRSMHQETTKLIEEFALPPILCGR